MDCVGLGWIVSSWVTNFSHLVWGWVGPGPAYNFFFSKSLLNAVESLQRIICTARGYDISFRLQV